MAFVRSIGLFRPTIADILQRNGECIVRIPLGFDDASGSTFSLVTAFSPLPGYDPGCHEFAFYVLASGADDGHISPSYDGLTTQKWIPDPSDRALVRGALRSSVEALVDLVNPEIVEMTTHTAHLPDKALTKFHEIVVAFDDKGYSVGKSDIWHGRHIWMMERRH